MQYLGTVGKKCIFYVNAFTENIQVYVHPGNEPKLIYIQVGTREAYSYFTNIIST